MAEEEWILATQESLGKLISKPKMAEKHLKKPPFRFLHDIVMEVTRATGFGHGLYSTDESDAAQLVDKQAKVDFLNKAISCVCFALGEKVDVSANKIVAGLEADKTNAWLQKLHAAATTCAGAKSDDAVQRVMNGESVAVAKDKKKKKEEEPAAAAPAAAAESAPPADDGAAAAAADEEAKKEEERRRRAEKKKREEEKRRKAEEEAAKAAAAAEAESPPDAAAAASAADAATEQEAEEEKKRKKEEERKKRDEEKKRREEKKRQQAEAEAAAAAAAAAEAEAEQQRAAAAAELPLAADPPSAPGSAAQPTRPSQSQPSPDEMAAPQGAPGGGMDPGMAEEERPQARPERPRTAGRRPPKVTSKVKESSEAASNVQATPAPIIFGEHETKDDDDDMYEAPQAANGMSGMGALTANENEQHSKLVGDLLNAKKAEEEKERLKREEEQTREEFDDGQEKGIRMGKLKRKKDQTQATNEVDVVKLSQSIQSLCQAANPLGKSIDLVHQDIANMGKELDHWKQEYREAAESYQNQLKQTEEMLQPLYQKVSDLDDKIADVKTKIRNSRSRIFKNDAIVQKLLESVILAK